MNEIRDTEGVPGTDAGKAGHAMRLQRFLLLLPILLVSVLVTIARANECLECHEPPSKEGASALEEGDPPPFPEEAFKRSVHADLACTDCHSDIKESPHEEKLKPVDCGQCHEDLAAEYQASLHGEAKQAGHADAPTCASCHGTHNILSVSDEKSPTFHTNIPILCSKCHENASVVGRNGISLQHPLQSYRMTVHGQAIFGEKKNVKAAVCSDCHSSHNLRKLTDPKSLLFKSNIPDTCGQCHPEEAEIYQASIHGQALQRGHIQAPTCTDCHGEHNILRPSDPKSFVSAQEVALYTCAKCHADEKMIQRFGFPSTQVSSYRDSYHGLSVRAGGVEAANCTSCHGWHNIRPASDPLSTVNPSNLARTCGQCHPGATDMVIQGKFHSVPVKEDNFWVFLVPYLYIPLIFLTIGGMFLHNLLDFIRKAVKTRNQNGNKVVRFSRNQRIQHFLLLTSFLTLVATGFALKFPDTWWVEPLRHFEGFFAMRSLIHRIAAVVMTVASVYHLFYIIFYREGRRDFRAMMPRLKDATDAWTNIKYYLFLSKDHPKFGRYSYMEKAEYLALLWGTFVMALTGFYLWFSNWALAYFPKWLTDVATLIHFYEATLATLAILVWHFYFVIFNKDVYPLNPAMFTGKISKELQEKEHPLEAEELAEYERDTEES